LTKLESLACALPEDIIEPFWGTAGKPPIILANIVAAIQDERMKNLFCKL